MGVEKSTKHFCLAQWDMAELPVSDTKHGGALVSEVRDAILALTGGQPGQLSGKQARAVLD